MSDNAGSGDVPEVEVHLDPPASEPPNNHNTNNLTPTDVGALLQETNEAAEAVPEGTEDLGDAELDVGDLNLAAALSSLPPEEDDLDLGAAQFDPDTLANLAALSRIQDEDEEGDGTRQDDDAEAENNDLVVETQAFAELIGQASLTNEQVQAFVDNFGTVGQEDEEEEEEEDEGDTTYEGRTPQPGSLAAQSPATDLREVTPLSDRSRDIQNLYYTQNGKLKRRRNRTKLYRMPQEGCDRNIPCSRCIKRGVPGMCHMEAPAVTQRKRKKPNNDIPVNYELGLRVQALQSLIRSGRDVDPDAASSAAMETVMQATRAANNGQPEAVNALAQLTDVSNNLSMLSADAQNSLLLDVLQQLSAASMGRPNANGDTNYTEMRDTWSAIPAAQPQTTVQIENAFSQDEAPNKLNLTVHGFREDSGRVFHPPTVRHAEKKLREDPDIFHETLPIEGYAPFLEFGTRFAYGEDNQAFKNKRIASIQAMSLTGGLRLAATFLSRFPAIAGMRSVYVPTPAADEDVTALRDGGLDVKMIRYLDHKHGGVDWEGFREDLQAAQPRSVVLLHVSGSIPTGAELTAPQWRMLTALLQERQVIPLVVMAFQGLSSGDTNRDAQPLRFMVHEGLPVVLVQGFDAMMGLYADSPAIVSLATQSADDRDRVDSQLRNIARAMYYHPPAWGARIAHHVLSEPKLSQVWLVEIKALSDRLRSVREKLFDLLSNKLKTPGDWVHIKRGAGMYTTLLLPQPQLDALTEKRHVHLLPESCVALGCLNAPKIDALARSVDWVVREAIREAEEQAEEARQMELALKAAQAQQEQAEAEALAAAEAAAAAAAQAEERLLMEESIQHAMEAQRAAEEEEQRQTEEQGLLEEQVRQAAERAEIARQAEMIVGAIQGF